MVPGVEAPRIQVASTGVAGLCGSYELRLSPPCTFRNTKLGELRGDRLAMIGWTDLLVDVKDLPVEADVKRPSRNALINRGGDAVG